MIDYEMVEADLTTLYQAASHFDGWSKDLAEEMIRVGEYSLALDIISYAYLNNDETMPADLFSIFEKLAVAMDMEADAEFEGVAELRTKVKAPASGHSPV